MINTLEEFYDFANRSHIFRRGVLYCGLGINIYAFYWAIGYANLAIEHPEIATAAIIGAILTPAGLLLGAMFKFYNEARSK